MGNKVPSLSRNAYAGMNDFQAVGIGDSDAVIETGTIGPRPPVSTPRKQQVAPEPKDSIVIPRDHLSFFSSCFSTNKNPLV